MVHVVCVVCVVKDVREKAFLISPRFHGVPVPRKQHEAHSLPYTPNYIPSSPLSLPFFATMASTPMNRDIDCDPEAQEGESGRALTTSAIGQTPMRVEQGEIQGGAQTQAAPEVDFNSGVCFSMRHGGPTT